jgi:hypothetical protein
VWTALVGVRDMMKQFIFDDWIDARLSEEFCIVAGLDCTTLDTLLRDMGINRTTNIIRGNLTYG